MGTANHDAIIVGGGPGGSTAATLLAKAGARVLLVEKEKFPRYQIGESLLPATVHGICRLLGVSDDLHAAGFIKKRGGTFRWGKHPTPWTFDFGSAEVNQILEFNFASIHDSGCRASCWSAIRRASSIRSFPRESISRPTAGCLRPGPSRRS